MTWCLVDSNNIVQNIIEYDGTSEYNPSAGLTLVQINSEVQLQATYINGVVSNPAQPVSAVEVVPTLAQLQAQLATLSAQISQLAGD